jgi:DNA-directed RNA polymerase I subunit RPA2
MERDALIAHGTSFLLQDRLMNCSDYSTAWVCRTCGSLVSLGYEDVSLGETVFGKDGTPRRTGPNGEYCRVCRLNADEEAEHDREKFATGRTVSDKPVADVRVPISGETLLRQGSKGGDMDVVAVPYVFRYLCAELASMGIAVSLEVV